MVLGTLIYVIILIVVVIIIIALLQVLVGLFLVLPPAAAVYALNLDSDNAQINPDRGRLITAFNETLYNMTQESKRMGIVPNG